MTPRIAVLALVATALACEPAALPPPAPAAPAPPAVASVAAPPPPADTGPRPPVAKKDPHVTELFGVQHVDDYFWLRSKGSPDVVSYLEAENAYADAFAQPFQPLAQSLYAEMLGRIQEDDTTPPVKDGAWLYYSRYEKGKQYPIHCRKRAGAKDAPEVVLLDVNELGAKERFIDVEDREVSDDGGELAYLVDTAGFRQFTLKVKDLRTGQTGPEAIPRVDGVAWARDGKTLLYVTEDPQTKRANQLWRHALGQDASRDTLVYEEKDEMFDVSVERTRSKAFILATSASHTTSEVRVLDAAKPSAPPRVVAPREHEHEYYVDHRGDLFYIRTNSGGRNFRIVTAPVADPRRENWKELVAHRPDVMLEDAELFADHMVVLERQDALPQLAIYDLKTGKAHRLDQPEPLFDVRPDANPEFGARTFRFRYQSLRTPQSWVETDVRTGARTVLKQMPVLGGYDPASYETSRIQIAARDGTPIPVSLVYRKGTQPDATHPLYLYGYGSYGFTYPLAFSSERVSLLDRGFVYAMAHIRGGGDLGKKWHDQGRMMTKMNTFTDFIDVGDGLKKLGWARPDGLVVAGGSAGGLLMGAVTNMRPDLFRIVLAYVPFVDVINTMLDETLPLTIDEFEEWGNPKKKDEYDYMVQYSPYDNVQAKAYPTMLVRSSYNDSQVMYWEPAKWVAKLRATKTDGNPLLLKMNMQPAGHGGQSGRYDRLHDTAWDYAFVLSQLGMH
jgi:oligopeptidase B